LIYDVTHVTRYAYAATVELTNGIMRLTPASDSEQSLEKFDLTTQPPSVSPGERIDAFGNRLTTFRIEQPHRELTITASSRVQVQRSPVPLDSLAWELVAEESLAATSLSCDSPALALYPSRRVLLFDEATSYARDSFSEARPIHEAALDLARRIRADFAYDPDATKVDTPAQEAFRRRRGVCQDFAHVMIAAVRGLGLPALYVSGYIRTIPPPGKERLAGADASHAWTSVWCGPRMGWKDFDPTNAQAVQNDHIVVARGRDYSEVSPVESLVLSSGHHTLDVEVDVVPVG
jgi:transglutaminase-like putative cysteine protease